MIISVLLLTILGVAVINSSSTTLAIQQTVFAAVGLMFFFFLKSVDFRGWKEAVKPLYIFNLMLLIVVFLLGVKTRGSLRWIPIGPLNIQPSEFAKIILILSLSDFWSRNRASWENIGKSLLILAPYGLLIFKQPDLGTTITLFFVWAVMLFASNISLWKLSLIGLVSFLVTPLFWLSLHNYQKQRFLSFLSPNQDPQGVGYNVIQSMIAVGSGQLTGRGLGHGTQSRLRFLPEFRTDFIFASIAEELGLLGSLIVLSLYIVIFYALFKIIQHSNDRFGELIVIGVTAMLFVQIVVNIGMNAGILPITGITLPLLSYGGSSLITTFIALGLAASVNSYGLKRKDIDIFSI